MRYSTLVILIGGLFLAGVAWLLNSQDAPSVAAIEPTGEAAHEPTPAPLPWLPTDSREAVAPPAMLESSSRPASELTLAALNELLATQNKAGCEQFIMDWFADGPAGVDRMLELMAGLSAPGEGPACGLLLQAAMTLMGPNEDHFQPWDRSSLISATMGLLDSNALVSGVATRGLTAFGAEASGEDVGVLIGLQSGADDPRFNDQGTQTQQLMLLQSWSKDLAPESLRQLESLALERGAWGIDFRELALQVSLAHDGGAAGQFYTQLLDQVAQENGEDSYAYSGSVAGFRKAAIYAHLNDTPEEKGQYIDELHAYPDLVGAVVTALDEEQANAVLATGHSGALKGFTRDVLVSMGSGDERYEATLRALGAPQFRELAAPSQVVLVNRAIAHDDLTAVQSNLEPPQASDTKATDKYWSLMTMISRGTKEQKVIETVVLPWIVATGSDPSSRRNQLLGELRDRYPQLDWIE